MALALACGAGGGNPTPSKTPPASPPVASTPLDSFNPTSGPPGTAVVLRGAGLATATQVTFAGVAATRFRIADDTLITAIAPAAAGTGPIVVRTPAGLLQTAGDFTVIGGVGTPGPDDPALTAFAPASGPVGAEVTLQGSNLTLVTRVAFGGVPSQNFSVISASQIIATVPPGAASGLISITTPSGQSSSPVAFAVNPAAGGSGTPPTLLSFFPVAGAAGTLVTLQGTDLAGATQVAFGGVPSQSFSVPAANLITASVPPGAASGPITVTTPNGSAATAGTFTVFF